MSMVWISLAIGIIVSLPMLYFLPYSIAKKNCHTQLKAIFILNLFLGFTLLGWVAALVWASTENNREKENSTEEADEIYKKRTSFRLEDLEKLAELKDKGIITQEEFDDKKKTLLDL